MEKKLTKKQLHELFFVILILIYVSILIIELLTVHLHSKASLFPNIVVMSIFIFSILKIISIISPKLRYYIEPPSLGSELKEELSKNIKITEKKSKHIMEIHVIVIWIWLLALLISFYLFGILITLAIGLFIFIFYISKCPLITSVTVTFGTLLFIYIIFIMIMRINVYKGILF